MKTIYKYPVQYLDEFTVDLPAGSEVLSVGVQYAEPQMWVRVDSDAPTTPRKFRLCGTDDPLDGSDGWRFIGTFLVEEDQLVFHLFEVVP